MAWWNKKLGEKPKEITLADIPQPLLDQIYRDNEAKFYENFEAYKLVPPVVTQKDGFKEWLPWIQLGTLAIILLKVFLIK